MPKRDQTAQEKIAQECAAQVLREFPTEWLNKLVSEIKKAAKRGDDSARKAMKLLTNRRFKK